MSRAKCVNHVSFGAMTAAELDLLYRRCAVRLRDVVRRDASASEAVVDEACQVAWVRLVGYPAVPPERTFGWLVTTAVREARRQAVRAQRDLSLEEASEGPDHACLPAAEGPERMVEQRLRAQALDAVSARQRRLLWLQALGCSHEEIAALTGCTPRTVHRQIVRARARLRASEGEG